MSAPTKRRDSASWGLLFLLALLCGRNSSEFYSDLDELNVNELVFVLSRFFFSNNSGVETVEQFIPLCTRNVCDFSGLTNFSQKLWKLGVMSEENIYRYIALCFHAFDPR